MSLVDAAAALDRLISRPLGGGGLNSLPSPHITARNDYGSLNHKLAQYAQLPCPITGPLPHLEHSPVFQKYGQNNEHSIPTCSTPMESHAPPLAMPAFAQQWGYQYEPQHVQPTVTLASDSTILSPTQASVTVLPLPATITQAQVSDPEVYQVNDKLGSPLQQFHCSNSLFSSDVKGRCRLSHVMNERMDTDEFIPLDPEKYKTELCRSFQVHGSCKYSFRCNYAHGLGQLKSPSRHGKYKTRNCQSYHRTGFCRYGARCSFIHDPEEGVLRCSIANKEVLEALHYHPEDESRIANITWRLDEDPLINQPASLHFIKSHTPMDENLDLDNSSVFLEPRDACSGKILPLTWTQPIDDKGDSTSESIKAFRIAYDNLNSKYENQTQFPFSKEEISKQMHEEKFVLNSLRLLDELAAAHPIPDGRQQHSQTAKIEELPDDSTPLRSLDTVEESKSLQCLDVVNDILKNSPNYSSSFWSVGGDDINSLLPDNLKKEVIDITDTNQNELTICTKYMDDSFSKNAIGNEAFEDANHALACSTLRSDYDEEPIEKNSTKKSNGDLNLADLIESLRVHEERQLARRPSSCNSQDSLDVSAVSPLSPDDTRLFDLTKYKTELCRSFQYNGFCKYGDACLYAHGGIDLRMYPKHPMYRTKKCFSFHNKGYCLYGSRCQFLHDSEE